jgi:hypothetical protein
VRKQAAMLSAPSALLLAISWLLVEREFIPHHEQRADGPEIVALRGRLNELLFGPFDAILAGADAGVPNSAVSRQTTALLLLGPVLLASLTRLPDFDYDGAIDVAVDNVPATHFRR